MRASHPPALSRRPDTVWVPKSKYLRASLVAASRVISTGVTSPTAPAATLRNNTHPRHAQPETYLMIRRLPRKINGRVMATRRRWGGSAQPVNLAVQAQDAPRPRSLMAFSLRISGFTSGLISSVSKSRNHRSGLMTGQSEPNSTLCLSRLFAYLTRIGGKYLGDHPDRSMYTFGLCWATDSASSCHGNEGCARMMGMSGKSTATSSINIGLEYFRRIPAPPGMPEPTPVCPVWNSAGTRASASAP